MLNLKFTKPRLPYAYILITLLGLIIGHSSSDNNKVRRRYDILNEALNSITVFLPTKYLWFSNSRLGFKQRREKWNEPKIIQFWGFYIAWILIGTYTLFLGYIAFATSNYVKTLLLYLSVEIALFGLKNWPLCKSTG